MKKILLLTSAAAFFLCLSGSAQVNTDSLALVNKISELQLKMGKLQNTITKKSNDKQDDSLHASQSAQANVTAATTLNANSQDQKDARAADNAAGTAKSDARKARSSADKLNDTNKQIADLQNKIFIEQQKLAQFTHIVYTPIPTANPVLPDSLQHD
jgi:hypothetical protein